MVITLDSCPVLPPVLDSFAVVIPVHNAVQTAQRRQVFLETLASIAQALTYFDAHYPYRDRATWEAILIDDGSTDGTLDAIVDWCRDRAGWGLVRHSTNRGPGAARNSGVGATRGAAIFFCDSDDRYAPEHFFVGFAALNAPLPPHIPADTAPDSPIPGIAPRYPGTVKTAIAFSDPIHPDWQYALQQTLLQNRAVRRELHQFVGGFPETDLFRRSDEDNAYNYICGHFASSVFVPVKTVEYWRHPGNAFDRQLSQFQRPMSEATQRLTPQDWERMRNQGIFARDKVIELQEKIQKS
ncbi:MAG: glycosyltransferase family A protein [Cyanophyceae cyanobacterium]